LSLLSRAGSRAGLKGGYLEVPVEGVVGVDAAVAFDHLGEVLECGFLVEDS